MRRALLTFYRTRDRDLPWRRTRNPYAIWISEVMLQQTRVTVAAPRFERFIGRFPDVAALAAAGAEHVCEEWAGLGYYRRARNLHLAAVTIVDDHRGRLPREPAQLERLPGIGRYTAGAIASIAFDVATPAVDGNTTRVLMRLLAIAGPAAVPATSERVWHVAAELVRGRRPGDINQALMELGQQVCLPTTPACGQCPLRRWCRAYELGEPARFPAAAAPVARRPLRVAFAWIAGRRGLWLERRPPGGLWEGQWQLPGEEGPQARRRLAERLGVALGRALVTIPHELSHRSVTATLHAPSRSPRLRAGAHRRSYPEPLSAPLSALARKAIEASPFTGTALQGPQERRLK